LQHIRNTMKKLIFILFVGLGSIAYGQEIIPFPDLSENHEAVYYNVETVDNLNYALYTEDYQKDLEKIDREIDEVNIELQNELIEERLTYLRNKKADLLKKKTSLLEEAELIEDLNKFY